MSQNERFVTRDENPSGWGVEPMEVSKVGGLRDLPKRRRSNEGGQNVGSIRQKSTSPTQIGKIFIAPPVVARYRPMIGPVDLVKEVFFAYDFRPETSQNQ